MTASASAADEKPVAALAPPAAGRRRLVWVVALLGLAPVSLEAQERDVRRIIDAVRAGGTSVVCRHAITRSMEEREPVSYEDPSTQRLLSSEGERQSRRIGEALRTLGITFDEVVASPMRRARRTADLMEMGVPVIDSIWHTNDGNYRGPNRDERLRALATPAPGNRLVVSHVVTMTSVLPDARGRLGEGDCAVVRPGDGSFTFLGVVPWEAWIRAAGPSSPHLREGTRATRDPAPGGARGRRAGRRARTSRACFTAPARTPGT